MFEETLKILGLSGGEVSIIGVLGVFIYLGIKAFTKVWNKHDEDMKTLKNEHIEMLNKMQAEHKETINKMNEDHAEAMKAQREAHLHEKNNYFTGLTDAITKLVEQIQVSNEVRNKISFDLSEVKSYQGEVRTAISHFNLELEAIKNMLITNGDKLSVILKCDINDNIKGYK